MTEDRWEAFGDYDDDRKFNEGVLAERERIIALLEAQAENWSSDCEKPLDPKHCQSCWLFVDLIALIKGETND